MCEQDADGMLGPSHRVVGERAPVDGDDGERLAVQLGPQHATAQLQWSNGHAVTVRCRSRAGIGSSA
jgi:hypothetical protein